MRALPSKQNKQKTVIDPDKPLLMSLLEPRVLESVYVPYSVAYSPTTTVSDSFFHFYATSI